jgi:hypothetical protein
MAQAFHTVALSLVYLLWSACRRTQPQAAAPSATADTAHDGDERVEHRLDCLNVLARPLPRRGS